MNDIELIGSGNRYDWNFTETDLVGVNGDASLVSAIRHTILLQKNELEAVFYADKGTRLSEIIFDGDKESATEIAKQTIEEECRQITGIQKVEAEVTLSDNNLSVPHMKITKNNGEEIEIGL